jgi:hypothetical protein
MALQGPIPVEFGTFFPDGAYVASGFELLRDFDRSKGDRVVQQIDKITNLPLWTVDVIDADQSARQRTLKVKVAAEHQPTLPPAPPGSPFTPVEFTGLMVTPYVNDANRLAYSLKATGVRAPSRGPSRTAAESKDAA